MAKLNKLKIKFKLQGLELEIEGTREEMPQVAQSLGAQLSGLFQPMSTLSNVGQLQLDLPNQTTSNGASAEVVNDRKKTSSSKRSTSRAPSTGGAAKEYPAIDWLHDSAKWGFPNQSWTASEKAIWLLYVVENEKQLSELTATQIANTFNKHFKQSKTIKAFTVTRDLGRKKVGKDAPVGENTTISPSGWYLTTSGKAVAAKMIEELRSK
jgi:hypothetical protein